jgi:hypothetical protein
MNIISGCEGFESELGALLSARAPIIYVPTHEETRAIAAIERTAAQRNYTVVQWALTVGWTLPCGNGRLPFDEDETDEGNPDAALARVFKRRDRRDNRDSERKRKIVYIFKALDTLMDDPRVVRWLQDCAIALRARTETIVLLSPVLRIPPHLITEISVLDFPLPDPTEISSLVDAAVAAVRDRALETRNIDPMPTSDQRAEVVRLLAGLTQHEAGIIVGKSLVTRVGLDLAYIATQKKAAIRKTEVLEIVNAPETLADVGGHETLKAWLAEAHASFSDEAQAFGVEPVRGGLLVGVPGSGKSLVPKAFSNEARLPLVRVDIGRLMGSLVGASESRARELTQILDASAPCVASASTEVP